MAIGGYSEGDAERVILLKQEVDGSWSTVANPVGAGGGAGGTAGTEYVEDAAAAANPQGGILILRRKDALSAVEVSADGDNIAANATPKGELYVKHPDTLAVTGTFWQAVQPVDDNGGSLTVDGPLTDVQLRATAVPVSGPLTDAQLRASAVPVSDGGGSITVDGFPAVQPVSDNGGSLTVDGPLTDTQLRATAVPVSDGAGSLTVDGTVAVSNFPAAQPVTDNGGSLTVDGTVTANQGTANTIANAWPIKITDGTNSLGVNAISGIAVDVTRVQGYVKQMGENSRVVRNFRMSTTQALTTADVLVSFTQWYNNATVAATTTPAVVPASKALRITAVELFIVYTGATGGWAEFDLRVNTAGLVAATSPNLHKYRLGAEVATKAADIARSEQYAYPDGLFDVPAGGGFGVTVRGVAGADVATAVTARVGVNISAYEYTP